MIITNKEGEHVRCFWLRGAQEFHRLFPVIVGEVLRENGFHIVHQFNNLFKPNIIIPIRKNTTPPILQNPLRDIGKRNIYIILKAINKILLKLIVTK
jgi:hypothetical protein